MPISCVRDKRKNLDLSDAGTIKRIKKHLRLIALEMNPSKIIQGIEGQKGRKDITKEYDHEDECISMF